MLIIYDSKARTFSPIAMLCSDLATATAANNNNNSVFLSSQTAAVDTRA